MFSHPKTQILVYENDGVSSLTEIYNDGLKDSIYDVVVFMHDDLIIETKCIGEKIIKLFDKNPEFGIIGIAGTTDLVNGRWWEIKKSMVGEVYHENEGKRWLSKYSKESYSDKLKDVVCVDGLFFMVDRRRIKKHFNEDFKGYHFYDISFCYENFKEGVKIGVTTKIGLTHKSIGMVNKQWEKNKLFFEALYEKELPAVPETDY